MLNIIKWYTKRLPHYEGSGGLNISRLGIFVRFTRNYKKFISGYR